MHKNVGLKEALDVESSLPLRTNKLLPYPWLYLMKKIQHFLLEKTRTSEILASFDLPVTEISSSV